MIIENTRFGILEIEDEKIITMKRDIPGFSGQKRFVLLNREESRPFLWYQSVDDPSLAFVLLNPFLVVSDYSLDMPSILADVSWPVDEMDHVAIFAIVNASSGVPEEMTANLMAPLVVNTKRFEAAQIIIQNSGYSHRYPIFEKTEEGEGEEKRNQGKLQQPDTIVSGVE